MDLHTEIQQRLQTSPLSDDAKLYVLHALSGPDELAALLGGEGRSRTDVATSMTMGISVGSVTM